MSVSENNKRHAFLEWAVARGVKFRKIKPTSFPNAGSGIVSTTAISGPSRSRADGRLGFSTGEEIAFCPQSALLNRETVHEFCPGLPKETATLAGLSTHALLAAAIAMERDNPSNGWRPWMDVWPSMEELSRSCPIGWTEEAKSLSPPSAKWLLAKMEERFSHDWNEIQKLELQHLNDKEIFKWAWLVVNTRTLFYKPDIPIYKDMPRKDCMTLCPFIDYFNHSDSGCQVEFHSSSTMTPNLAGYSVTPTTLQPADTQVFVSYGCHSNDFLLIEYGFLPYRSPSSSDRDQANKWDEVLLDPLLIPLLHPAHLSLLDEEGFLGNYIFDKTGFCFRTQAAVRLLLIPHSLTFGETVDITRWKAFLKGADNGVQQQPRVDAYLLELLERLIMLGDGALTKITAARQRTTDNLGLGGDGNYDGGGELESKQLQYQLEVVERRWKQVLGIVDVVEAEMKRSMSECNGNYFM